jgi:hypothetical protein
MRSERSRRPPGGLARLALAAIAIVAMAACSRGANLAAGTTRASSAASSPLASGATGDGAIGGGGGQGGGGADGASGGDGSEGGGGGDSSQSSTTTDDLRVFGFATSDEGQLAGEVAQVSDTVGRLAADAAARDPSAAQADAATLLNQARTLEADADDATKRQRPLDPANATLARARGDAIDAFGMTAAYAATVVDLAEAALDLNVAELISVAQQAVNLEGMSAELEAAYEGLNRELTAWAQDHPAEAAEALARFAT